MKKSLKKKIKQCLAISMAFSMVFSSNAFATPIDLVDSTESVATDTLTKTEGTDHFADEDTNVWNNGEIIEEVRVSVQRGSEFIVTIPKDIVLDGETGKADYVVNAKGDIAGNQVLKVVPDAEFELAEAGGKDSVTATVIQNDTDYTYVEMQGDGTDYPGNVEATLTAGEWAGKFAFNITFNDDKVNNNENNDSQNENLFTLSYITLQGSNTKNFNSVSELKEVSTNNPELEKAVLVLNNNETTPKQDLSSTFINNENLTEVDLTNIDKDYISSIDNMFEGSPNLEKVYITQALDDSFDNIEETMKVGDNIIEIVDKKDTSIKETLNDYTWTEIAEISKAREAENYFNLGDEKQITIGDEVYTAVIYGFNDDELADGTGTAGITFGFKEVLTNPIQMYETEDDYIITGVNNNGYTYISEKFYWENTKVREYLNNEFILTLPEDLQKALKERKTNQVMVSSNSYTHITGTDKIFIPGIYNVSNFGGLNTYYEEEISYNMYDLVLEKATNSFIDINNLMCKKDLTGNYRPYWTISPSRERTFTFYYIYSRFNPSYDEEGNEIENYDASYYQTDGNANDIYVAPFFCI